jgi:signal peptidase complex subunit 3
LRGRPHYYSTKKEEYASIRFSLDADLSSLFTWNTKQVFVYVSASWPANTTTTTVGDTELGLESEDENEAVIWDTIITNPSADHLQNIGPAAMKKLVKSAKGKTIDPSRFVLPPPPKTLGKVISNY